MSRAIRSIALLTEMDSDLRVGLPSDQVLAEAPSSEGPVKCSRPRQQAITEEAIDIQVWQILLQFVERRFK